MGDSREVHRPTGFWWEDLRARNHLKDLVVDRRIIFKTDLQEVGWGDADWINLAQDRDRWQVLVNAVMNLRIP
jgi:hypothetical protein